MRRLRAIPTVVFLVSLPLLGGCVSAYTAIQREEPTGKYILTGWENKPFVGLNGFVRICDYDPKTKTLYVREDLPR